MGLQKTFQDETERHTLDGDLPVTSLYTAGQAGMKFFTAIKDEEKLLGSRCEKCSTTTLLPRAFCERCLSPTADYPEVQGPGQVKTWTVLRRDMDGKEIDDPGLLALVVYDGVEGGIIHKLGDVDQGSVKVGLRVEPVFRPQAEREGSILDISHFRPAASA